MHIDGALNTLFNEFADNHTVKIYGEPSPQFVEMVDAQMARRVNWFSFLQGLESREVEDRTRSRVGAAR
jgi:hypothetical protein